MMIMITLVMRGETIMDREGVKVFSSLRDVEAYADSALQPGESCLVFGWDSTSGSAETRRAHEIFSTDPGSTRSGWWGRLPGPIRGVLIGLGVIAFLIISTIVSCVSGFGCSLL